jgi:hypothetical protein
MCKPPNLLFSGEHSIHAEIHISVTKLSQKYHCFSRLPPARLLLALFDPFRWLPAFCVLPCEELLAGAEW